MPASTLHLLALAALLAPGAAQADDGTPTPPEAPAKVWVFFTDKGDAAAAILPRDAALTPRALARRRARRTAPGLADARDLPVAAGYLDAVVATGARHVASSRWLNAASVLATAGQRKRIAALGFVDSVQPVRRTWPAQPPAKIGHRVTTDTALEDGGFYGRARQQIEQLRLDRLHALGFTGKGVVVAVVDTGFRRRHEVFNHPGHPLKVTAERDFMSDDASAGVDKGDPAGQYDHGTMVLAVVAGYRPGEYVGAAYDASYVLVKAEDAEDEFELEEDWFVAALEFAEAQGADVISSSLVAKWYKGDALDGRTSAMVRAVNVATANGLHVVQGSGNRGHDSDPATQRLGTPSDAFAAITVGAVDRRGEVAAFSSDGPTVDGRLKPEVLARGEQTVTIAPTSHRRYRRVDGTSVATPLVAGVVACLVQAHPDWSVAEMRAALFSTARRYSEKHSVDPEHVEGYGLVDALAAHRASLCTGEEELTQVSCEPREGGLRGYRLVVRTRRGEPYAVHTLRLGGDPEGDLEIRVDSEGTGRAVFRGVAAGRHAVELVQCGTKLTALCR